MQITQRYITEIIKSWANFMYNVLSNNCVL